MVKLSIIIPYYKTFEMTARLLGGLWEQLTDDVEVIVVDDGCNETFLDMFEYDIKVIHLKENGGVSKARNIGIKEAQGEYIAFIDSDDMVTMDYVEQLLKTIKEHNEDMIIFNWLDITTNEVVIKPQNPAIWKAIYKKDIIPLFDETLRVREDYFFNKALENKNPSKSHRHTYY